MLVAGVDVGNSTTEVAFARVEPGQEPTFLLVLRTETTGAKGSAASAAGARALLDRGARRIGETPRRILLAELRPVETDLVEERHEHDLALGRTAVARPGSTTPGGIGCAVGTLRALDELAGEPRDATIAVTWDADFDRVGERLRDARARGWAITGVIVASDDGVLVANRFDRALPVVDEVVDAARLPLGARAAIEVASAGGTVVELADPLRIAVLLGLDPSEARAARDAARALAGERSAIVVLRAAAPVTRGDESSPAGVPDDALDVFRVPLPSPRDDAGLHLRLRRRTLTGVATLRAIAADDLAGLLDAEVVAPEWLAATLGAATTPGAGSAPFVLDLGGGTVDAHRDGAAVALAGAGALVTRICGGLLDAPTAVAERAKRVRSARVETPFILHHEDASRTFLPIPAPPEAVGRLCLVEHDGLVPLRAAIAPEVWGGLRRDAKRVVLGANARRAIERIGGAPPGELVVLAGGCASDPEVVTTVSAALADLDLAVARADVLGLHGPRAAVAVGLVRAFAGRR
jgi:hypothetical protein